MNKIILIGPATLGTALLLFLGAFAASRMTFRTANAKEEGLECPSLVFNAIETERSPEGEGSWLSDYDPEPDLILVTYRSADRRDADGHFRPELAVIGEDIAVRYYGEKPIGH